MKRENGQGMSKDRANGKAADGLEILAPLAGWFGPLDEAPDPVFAGGMMGAGGLIDPVAGEVRAPCDGVVLNLPDSLHALTLQAVNGAEVLIHVGIETVGLRGQGFTAHVDAGSPVSTGDLLLSFDLDVLAEKAASLQTPVLIANEGFEVADLRAPGQVVTGDTLFKVSPCGDVASREEHDETTGPTVQDEVQILLGNGLHARPAARLADLAKQFDAAAWLCLNGKRASARSPVALMTLGVVHGDTVTVETTGKDAERLLASLVQAIFAGLGEQNIPAKRASQSAAEPQEVTPIALDGSARLPGVTAAPGLVIGPVIRFRGAADAISEQGQGSAVEHDALMRAMAAVRADLEQKAERAEGQEKEILSAHLILLDDELLIEEAESRIREGASAAFAWHKATQSQIIALKAMKTPLLGERAADLADLEAQVIAALTAEADAGGQADTASCKGAVVVAEDLFPSQFLQLAGDGAAGICLTRGGATSHVSILAAEKGMPALVAVGAQALTIADGTAVILDADGGTMHVAPTPETIAQTRQSIQRKQANHAAALADASRPATTQDGVTIKVFANLGGDQKADAAVRNGAEGCGLLRTEFLYLGRATPPSEEEQAAAYQAIAESLSGRPLVIRTLDIGGDKPAAFIDFGEEENPALGLRGTRLIHTRPDLIETQLRAILRVTPASQVSIMLPMITSADEIVAVQEMLDRLRTEMSIVDPVPLGIMVETPASAVTAETLAPHVSFFSIGTNDLSQYTLAMDRGNPALAARADSFHPAVLRLIAMTGAAGTRHGKWVGVCGSMASQTLAAPLLAGLGVTELSATASAVPSIKAVLRSVAMEDCRKAAETALGMDSAEAVRKHMLAVWPHLQDWV